MKRPLLEEMGLIMIAEESDDQEAIDLAIKLLRERYDPTYDWCDGRMVKQEDCYLND